MDGHGSCKACHHARQVQQQLYCCRMPPQVVAMPIINRLTQQAAIEATARFPLVEDGAWCGEYQESEKNRVLS